MIPKIRSLLRDELEEAWQLHKKGFPYIDVTSREDYLRYRSKAGFDFDQIVVAEVDGKLVGKIEVYKWMGSNKGKMGFMDGFVVDPDYREQGMGTQLLLEAERRAMKKGMIQLDLGVKIFSKAAIALYKKLGYKKIHRVFFMKKSLGNFQISEPPNDILVGLADPLHDPRKLIKMSPNVWWTEYLTEEALRADIERNPEEFFVLKYGGKVQAYIKYSLSREAHINSLAISNKTEIPLRTLVKYMLKKVLAQVTSQKTVYIEVDEHEKKLVKALTSLGFEKYETELHMMKKLF